MESTITVGDFSITPSETDSEVGKSVRTQLNPTTLCYIHQSTGYSDIYRPLHLTAAEYSFSQAHMRHLPRQTISWAANKAYEFKRMKIIQCLLSYFIIKLKLITE